MLYEKLLKPLLFHLDPETAHNYAVSLGELCGRYSPSRAALDLIYGYHGQDASVRVDGLDYRTPILLSAGFDYNARLVNILPSVGFGGVEVGSVTAQPCAGNPVPRLTRLPRSGSIVVNKGLKNDGVDQIITRLSKQTPRPGFVTGVSIARTNIAATAASVEAGIADYLESFTKLNQAGTGDYYTINISCPNAHGGETFAQPERLEQLLNALETVPCAKPIYVKLPINLAWPEYQALLKVLDRHRVNGVVIGNLNKDYSSLQDQSEAPVSYRGGLSGRPCFLPSNQLIRRTRAEYGRRFTIIGSGGIFSPADAMVKFAAGADLVQLITGMIYRGPGLIKRIATSYNHNRGRLALWR
jgi:dihydroorotate dehydrogenase subfamily 2